MGLASLRLGYGDGHPPQQGHCFVAFALSCATGCGVKKGAQAAAPLAYGMISCAYDELIYIISCLRRGLAARGEIIVRLTQGCIDWLGNFLFRCVLSRAAKRKGESPKHMF